jgi:glycosyltransferase involved in cell wall biosynthesis
MENKMVDISIIIPVLNEEKNIPILHNRLTQVLTPIKKTYEIIFIDDGSTDNTIIEIKKLVDKNTKLIEFRRNFGKAYALDLGFKEAKGKIIFTMDGDLQDDPREIPRFLEAIKHYDLVSGWKFRRKDPITKKLPSKLANYITRKSTGVKIHDMNCGFKAYRSETAKSITLYGDMHRYIPALVTAKGFRVGEIRVKHHKRVFGKSKYGFTRLFRGLFDFMTIKFLTNYSNRPLHFFGGLGLLSGFLGGLIELIALYFKFVLKHSFLEHISLIIFGFVMMLMGLQLISLGLLGEMIIKKNDAKKYEVRKKSGF